MPRHLHTSSVIRKHPKALARAIWHPGKKCGWGPTKKRKRRKGKVHFSLRDKQADCRTI